MTLRGLAPILCLASALAAGHARAQCNNSTNPAPPPAISASYANQTFGGPPEHAPRRRR